MQLAPATIADSEEITGLVNRAYRGERLNAGWTHERDLFAGPRVNSSMLSDILQAENSCVLLLRRYEDGQPIGCVALKEIDAAAWRLSLLAVDPPLQASGLGRAILGAAEQYARERGAQSVRISVLNHRISLLEWYKRRGYAQTGVVELFPYSNESVGIPLRQDLSLIVLRKSLHAA